MYSVRKHPTKKNAFQFDVYDPRRRQLQAPDIAGVMSILTAREEFVYIKRSPFTVAELIDWMLTKRESEGCRGLRRKHGRLRFAADFFGDVPACELEPKDIERFYKELVDAIKTEPARYVVRELGGVFAAAVKDGVVTCNPALDLCKLYPQPRVGPVNKYITPSEEFRIVAACTTDLELALILLPTRAGLGQAELAALRHGDIMDGVIRVAMTIGDYNKLLPARPYAARTIKLDPETHAVLARLGLVSEPDDFVFRKTGGGYLTPKGLTAKAQRVMFRAGLGGGTARQNRQYQSGYTIENLTHRACLKWLELGLHPAYVCKRMGFGSYTQFTRRFRPFIDARPAGKPVAALDDYLASRFAPVTQPSGR